MSQLGTPTDLVPKKLVVVALVNCQKPLAMFTSTKSSESSNLTKQRYHLRRSNFLQTFNASPDETAYYRMLGTWLVCRYGKEQSAETG